MVGVAVSLRLSFVLAFQFRSQPLSDEPWFHDVAANIAAGRGIVWVELDRPAQYVPTATHPPGFPALLALFNVLGIETRSGHRILMSLLAGVGVLFVGLVGRRLAGPVVGLAAAGIAALHPLWLIPVGVLASESLVLVVAPVVVYVSLRCLDRPTVPWFVALGALIGVFTLTRSEALTLIVLAGIPVTILAAGWSKQAARLFGALALTALVVVAPWIVRNQDRFGAATLSTNLGQTVAGTYCDDAFRLGPDYGSIQLRCIVRARLREFGPSGLGHIPRRRYVQGDRRMVWEAARYALEHPVQMPGVMGARVVRTLGLWPQGPESLDIGVQYWPWFSDPPGVWASSRADLEWAGIAANWALLVLAFVGAAAIPKSDRRWWVPVMIPIAMVLLLAMFVQGTMRTRMMAEPSIAILAAFGAVHLWRSARARMTRATTPRGTRHDTRTPTAVTQRCHYVTLAD